MFEYARFTEKDHEFVAYLPSSDSDPMSWKLEILKDGKVIRTEELGLNYNPLFGPDVMDVQNLEKLVDDTIKSLDSKI